MPGAALDLFGGSSGQNSALENVIDRLNRNIPITPMRIITPMRDFRQLGDIHGNAPRLVLFYPRTCVSLRPLLPEQKQ